MFCPVCGVEFQDNFCSNCGFDKSQNKTIVELFSKPYLGETEKEAENRIKAQQKLLNSNKPSNEFAEKALNKPSSDEILLEELEYTNELLESIKGMLTFFTVLIIILLSLMLLGALYLIFSVLPVISSIMSLV